MIRVTIFDLEDRFHTRTSLIDLSTKIRHPVKSFGNVKNDTVKDPFGNSNAGQWIPVIAV